MVTNIALAMAFNIPYRFRPPLQLQLHQIQIRSKSTPSSLFSSLSSSSSSTDTESSRSWETVSTNQPPAQLLDYIDQITKPYIDNDLSRLGPESIFERINEEHDRDIKWAKASSLPFESEASEFGTNSIEYEPVSGTNSLSALAIRSKRSTPVLSGDEIQLLRRASESYWNRELKGENEIPNGSRFTYQRRGNSEAHLSDVVQYAHQCNANNELTLLVRNLLLNRIYPWIREAYLSQVKNGDEMELYVYDSLLIRYNATEANADFDLNNHNPENYGGIGAGQPLHRDLGFVSVNIMLNSQEEFEGGGTFFEDQLLPLLSSEHQCDETSIQPLKPIGPGHAIAHFSNSRHAGAATYAGVRDILVIFLAATENTSKVPGASKPGKVPSWEYNARIKANARTHCSECSCTEDQLICRIVHHRLAIDKVIHDGEAWQYLGMALLDYHYHLQRSDGTYNMNITNNARAGLDLAVSCLYEATKYTPCDGRLYNNLGIALEQYLHCETFHSAVELHDRVISAYERTIKILSKCERLGIDVSTDYASACLNYGLYLSKRDKFNNAIDVLSKIVPPNGRLLANHRRLITDASNLLSFCKRQLNVK